MRLEEGKETEERKADDRKEEEKTENGSRTGKYFEINFNIIKYPPTTKRKQKFPLTINNTSLAVQIDLYP